MKKTLVAILSLAAFVACSQDTVVKTTDSAVIGFENFVEIKTRVAEDPSTTTGNIKEFSVWGFKDDPQALIFKEELVYRNGDNWKYDNLQYWQKGAYFFGAISPAADPNVTVDITNLSDKGLGTLSFTNVNGGTDVLYAEMPVVATESFVDDPSKVNLTFAHLLSKIKFSFAHNIPNDLTTIVVKDVKITNSPANGTFDLTADRKDWAWTLSQNGAVQEINFGAVENGAKFAEKNVYYEADLERLVIPTDATRVHNITFVIEVYNNGVLGGTYNHTVELKDKAFLPGKKYNLKATIDLEETLKLKPIEFTVVEVEDWEDGDVIEEPKPEEPQPVALATPEVKADVKENVVTLTWDPVEGAAYYTVQVDDDVEERVDAISYVFEGDYEVEYMFTVKAIAADAEKNLDSEACVVKATTEAKPVVEPEEPAETVLTVAEFLALTDVVPSDATAEEIAAAPLYTLTGTITSVTQTTYGNFYLNDGTGEVLIYGLVGPNGETKYWANSGAKVGDDITVKTIRTEYNNAPQGKNATFVEVKSPGTLAFWSFEASAASFTAAGGEKTIKLDIYNATAEVVATSDNAQFSASYANGVLTISAEENTEYEAVEGNITVTCGTLSQVITVSQAAASQGGGEQTEVTAELKFVAANRTSWDTSKQTWEVEGVKLVNEKGSSTSNVADYVNPARFYKSSKITVTADGNISTIVFDCNSASYATALKDSIKTGTVSVSSDKVTVTLDGSSNEFVIASLTGGQVRMDSMTVTYLK